MTNTPAAGKLSIIKCDQCRDGYLVVKPGKDKTRYMLGCTNYKSDGSGCSRIMSPKYFCEYMHITDMEPAEPIVVPKGAEIKPKSGRVQQNTVTTQKTEQTIQAPVLKPIEYGGFDLNITIVTILKTLSDVSKKQYYGASTLVDILRGSKSKKIQTAKLNKINGYGKLSAIKRENVEFLVDWLIENGFILKIITRASHP